MKTRICLVTIFLIQLAAHANPATPIQGQERLQGESLIAFQIVTFFALVLESWIVTLILLSTGIRFVRTFITLTVANISVFLFAFLPLATYLWAWLLQSGVDVNPGVVLEPGVVLLDALAIKLLVKAPFLQGPRFVGVGWRRALVASLVGNAASFLIGVFISLTVFR
jgi:hypothetical protein